MSDDEKTLKASLEEAIKVFFQLLNQFEEKRNVSLMEGFNHFQEIRRKIDLQREELKDKIDKIYFALIDQTKAIEASYKSLYETVTAEINDDVAYNSFDDEMQHLNDSFREINISMDLIKQKLLSKTNSICELKSKLNELDEINECLIESNEFQPNDSFDLDSFGQLSLASYLSDPFKSQILNVKQAKELIKLCEFNLKDKWKLIYRASQHGFNSNDFHSRCDAYSSTLTILKTKQNGNIFGGYTSQSWCPSTSLFKYDPHAFIFSLVNKDKLPCKILTNYAANSIRCKAEYGPTFGCGFDIFIANNAHTSMESCSNLGSTYKHSDYDLGTHEAKSFLAGSYKFQLSEIEVYLKD